MPQWTGKVVGGLIGMLALGPFGAAVGVLLGHQFDANSPEDDAVRGPRLDELALGERFFRTTFQVMGHVAKADGRVSEQEIEAARSVMGDLRLNPLQVRTAIGHFTAGKQADFNLQAALAGLRAACAGRPDLLRIFMEIQMRAALAGSNLDGPVRSVMQRAAAQLGVSLLELAQMETVLRIRRGSFSRAGLPRARVRGDCQQRRCGQGLPASAEPPSPGQTQGERVAGLDDRACQAEDAADHRGLRAHLRASRDLKPLLATLATL
jgi:DnaJ like chaperone protein